MKSTLYNKNRIIFIAIIIGSIVISYYSTDGFKSQFVRILDVCLIGPLLIYVGFFVKDSIEWSKYPLISIGIATIIYNGKNFLVQGKYI